MFLSELLTALVAFLLFAGCEVNEGNTEPGKEIEIDETCEEIIDEGIASEEDFKEETEEENYSDILDTEDWSQFVTGTLSVPFNLDVRGMGSFRFEELQFSDGFGYVITSQNIPSFSYELSVWDEYGIILFHILAPLPDNLKVIYLYCGMSSSTSLDVIWSESFDEAMLNESASGTCEFSQEQTTVNVEVFDLKASPSSELIVKGFTVTGSDINLASDGGEMIIPDGRKFRILPFEAVDCTSICTSDPAMGWWELHMILENESDGERCFGILYLMLAEPQLVTFAYGFCLRNFTPMEEIQFQAQWSVTDEGRKQSFLPSGPLHQVYNFVLRPFPLRYF